MTAPPLDVKELPRMPTPRARRRRNQPGCLDMAHRNPDLPCPYCTTPGVDPGGDGDPGVDPIIEAATRQHAQTRAEDTDGFGWPT